MRQRGLTVVTRILPEKVDSLRKLLDEIGEDIKDNRVITFTSFRTVHFLRWVILDETIVRNTKIPAQLVLSTNYDGPLDPHLEDLCGSNLEGLFKIYNHCEGVPMLKDTKNLSLYLKENRIPIPAFYRGTVGRTVDQIHKEQSLWNRIQGILGGKTSGEPAEIKSKIISDLKKEPEFNWAFNKYKPELVQSTRVVFAFLGAILTLAIALVLLPILLVWWILIRGLEKRDKEAFIASRQDPSQIAGFMKKEDYKVQNQLTHLVEIKPGIIRLNTLKFVLWAINLLAKMWYNKGNLGGIQSIHFARWVIIDEGKRLLFFSNYDGSWESYLGEFVDRAAVGLTGVWSNTVGFPPTKNLIRQGARHSAEFKAWAREKQIQTQVWYSAYPTSSIKNINNNTAIRQGLIEESSPEETREWLQRM